MAAQPASSGTNSLGDGNCSRKREPLEHAARPPHPALVRQLLVMVEDPRFRGQEDRSIVWTARVRPASLSSGTGGKCFQRLPINEASHMKFSQINVRNCFAHSLIEQKLGRSERN